MNQKTTTYQVRRIATFVLAFAIVFALIAAPPATSKERSSFIVQGSNLDEVTRLIQSAGGEVTSHLEIVNGVAALIPKNAVTHLRSSPSITSITPNSAVLVANKGGYPPTPSSDYADVTGADFTWEQGITGEGVTVAVVDTGLGWHPGLFKNIDGHPRSRIIGWVDFVDGRRSPTDPYGHGTHVAGIIANSQVGIDAEWNGVAPGINLVGVRVLDKTGSSTYEKVIQGIQWVIEHKDELNIRVMNLSLVAPVLSPYWADPLNQAVMQAWAEGITVVVASGNDGPEPMTIGVPGNNPYVVTVGAFTDNFTPDDWDDDYITPFSAAGPTLDGFVKPDLVAPGAHIISTMMEGSNISRNHQANRISANYFSMAGTSQATAVVSGIAALVLSHNPDLTPDQVKHRLMYTSFPWIDLETTNALYSMWQQGAGRVSAPDAVFTDADGEANYGMDILTDLAGTVHYEGFSYFDETTGEFRLRGEFNGWTGGYGNWAGGYGNWAGGYGNWAGGYGNWAGGYGNWAGGYGNWASGYGNWAGGYGNWAGGYGNWAGGYGNWAGGYGNWAGGYGNWAGSHGDPLFVEEFVKWEDAFGSWAGVIPWTGTWVDFDG